jgi:hypothetical protein
MKVKGWFENAGFFHPSSFLNVNGYFRVELSTNDIPFFIKKFLEHYNEKKVKIDLAIKFPSLRKPYSKFYTNQELKEKLKENIRDYTLYLSLEKLEDFLSSLFKKFGTKGLFLSSKNFYLRVCDDLKIEIISRKGINFEHTLENLIEKTKPRFKLPIEGRYKILKNIVKIDCRSKDFPSLLYEVLHRLKIKKCIIDLFIPLPYERNFSYLISLKKRGFEVNDKILEKEFKPLGLKFNNFKTITTLDKMYKIARVLDAYDFLIYTKYMAIKVVNSRDYIGILVKEGKVRKKLLKILKKILTGKLPGEFIEISVGSEEDE